MEPKLPDVLNRYFSAQNRQDIEAQVACFAPDATVHDEGRDIVGTDAIHAWKTETTRKYSVSVQPLECRAGDGKTIVIAKVSGNFPGSPANLTYRFGLGGRGIQSLDIG